MPAVLNLIGGRSWMHLGLALINIKCATINPTLAVFGAPNFPAALKIPAGATQVEALALHKCHTE